MTLGQMNSKLIKAQEAETHLDRALLCRALLEDAVDFIYSKAGAKKPPKASLLELIDSPVVTGYTNDVDTVNALHYVRILGMNGRGREILAAAQCGLPIDTSLKSLMKQSREAHRQGVVEERCGDVYSLAFAKPRQCGYEFTAKPVILE